MNRNVRQWAAICVGTLLAPTLLTACGSTSNAAESDTAGSSDLSGVTLNVADIQWKSDEALFKAAGLDDTPYTINTQVFDGGNNSIQAVSAGQLDYTRVSELPVIFAASSSNGANFIIPAVLNDGITAADQGIIVAPESEITSIKDLNGKKVGYVEATTSQYFLYKFLESNDLSWSDIEPVKVSPADGATALLNGDIDAYAGFGGGVNVAVSKGAKYIAHGSDVLPPYYPCVIPKNLLSDDKKRAALFDFLSRSNAAYQWIADNPEEWAKISAEPSGQTVESQSSAIKRGLSQVTTTVIPPSQEVTDTFKGTADVFEQIGLITTSPDIDSLFTNEYDDELQAAIDRYVS